ncbi:hypothetical protein ACS0TY_016892 [Phlomoides rotata]
MGDHFKECAYAPNRRIFEEKLAIFKEVGGSIVEEWLEQLPYDKWALAYSPHITRYGEMTSNVSELFNSWSRGDDIYVGLGILSFNLWQDDLGSFNTQVTEI